VRVADNVALVQRAFESLAEGGVESMLPFVHGRFEMTTPTELASEPDTYRGHDGVRRWFDSFYDAMDEVRLEPIKLRSAGDEVAVWLRIVARGRTTSLELVQEAAALCSLEDRKIQRIRFFVDWDEAMAELGL